MPIKSTQLRDFVVGDWRGGIARISDKMTGAGAPRPSGSLINKMKLLVPSGTLLHDNCGEIFSPTQFGLLSRLARLSATCFPLIISRWQTAATFTTTHSRQKILKKRLPWRRVQDALRSVPRAVDQRPLLDPRHHVAQLGADLLDRMRCAFGAHRLERSLIDFVLQHPLLDEFA